MVDREKGGGRAAVHPPPPSLGWADFTLMMECTPESGHCHSVCTLRVAQRTHFIYQVYCLYSTYCRSDLFNVNIFPTSSRHVKSVKRGVEQIGEEHFFINLFVCYRVTTRIRR
jgi:hypothetical protein